MTNSGWCRSFLHFSNEAPEFFASRQWAEGNDPVFYTDAVLPQVVNNIFANGTTTTADSQTLDELPATFVNMAELPDFIATQQVCTLLLPGASWCMSCCILSCQIVGDAQRNLVFGSEQKRCLNAFFAALYAAENFVPAGRHLKHLWQSTWYALQTSACRLLSAIITYRAVGMWLWSRGLFQFL